MSNTRARRSRQPSAKSQTSDTLAEIQEEEEQSPLRVGDQVEYHPIHQRSSSARQRVSRGWIREMYQSKGDDRFVIENYRTHKRTVYSRKSIERKVTQAETEEKHSNQG